MGRAGSGSRLYTILMSALHRVWYPTLIDLRATSLAYAIKTWEEFGARVGIIEAEESAFWGNVSPTTSGMSGHAASASTTSSPLFCSWRECGFHGKNPRHVLQTCSGSFLLQRKMPEERLETWGSQESLQDNKELITGVRSVWGWHWLTTSGRKRVK
ncbi:hypothetical protein HETIRDRAFT_314425 [Heterobasidion irregulare TC 32-1]|uniref:Uncharacterized protein n=1 Tax=Heterobasidion irregulare (strain TC 32-1) TaxID=747525 RepID=W4KI13_HETIT|nr:uncharacterized protein HETIRDRAFT_314425 [Heterobasidion irregulare TC 32-1]ETW84716.1 hypothetical protein HETIRDRAFT_314425 [Heterobasidion irregulare TC 32-1]